MTKYFYSAFGMTIGSDFILPELRSENSKSPTNLIISRTHFDETPSKSFDFSGPIKWLYWDVIGRFAVHPSGNVEVELVPDADEKLLPFPLLGPVMATVLEQRGMLVLHASAVALDGRAVIFLGNKTAGKSTTAAAMVSAGCQLLSDDVVAITLDEEGRGWVLPAFDQIKLSDEAARDIGLTFERFDHRDLSPALTKCQHRTGASFASNPMEVGLVCVLERGFASVLVSVSASEALLHVIRFSHLARFKLDQMPREVVAKHFEHCSALAARYPIERLMVPANIPQLVETLPVLRNALGA